MELEETRRNEEDMREVAFLREEPETILHRIAFTVWHAALHIEREVRYTHLRDSSRPPPLANMMRELREHTSPLMDHVPRGSMNSYHRQHFLHLKPKLALYHSFYVIND